MTIELNMRLPRFLVRERVETCEGEVPHMLLVQYSENHEVNLMFVVDNTEIESS